MRAVIVVLAMVAVVGWGLWAAVATVSAPPPPDRSPDGCSINCYCVPVGCGCGDPEKCRKQLCPVR